MGRMLLRLLLGLSLLLATGLAVAEGLLERSYRPLAGKAAVNLDRRYGGDVLLIVNTASKCGYTPQ